MALKEFPELKALFDKLMTEKEGICKKSAKLWKRYNELQEELDPIKNEMREVSKKIHEIERPRLGEIDTQLSAIARATGGRFLNDGQS